MIQTFSSLVRSAAYWSKQAVVRWTLLVSIVAFWFIVSWLQQEYGQEDSTLWLVMRLFTRLVQWTLVGLIVLGIGSALASWAHFRFQLSGKRVSVDVRFGDGQKAEAGWVPVSIRIDGQVFRPLLGMIKGHLVFAGKQLSKPVLLDLDRYRPKRTWRTGIQGHGRTLLHDRGIHDVDHVLFTFADMFSLVSLPATVDAVRQVYTLPRAQPPAKVAAQPHSTEEQKHRIDIPKRVEGEHVVYKEFESGDNIRRIVWKIYAKSGELVVRIPEIKDPYASHLYFYVSYFHGLKLQAGAFETELLNAYKDHVRNLLEALQQNGYDVRIPPDQEVPKLAGLSEKKTELFQITAANWQDRQSPTTFVNAGKAAFVCLPSLTPAAEVAAMMKKLPEAIPIVVVKLSASIPSPFQFSWKDILFSPEPTPADRLSKPWLLSSLRRDILRNEKEIEALVRQRQNTWMTEAIVVG